jgi:hypothetical protein
MTRTTLALLAAVLALAVAAAGCGGDDDDGAAAGGTTMTMAGHEMPAASSSSAAADTRVTLDRLLGEHAMLAMFATQKGLKGEDDFEAIAGALDANSQDLAKVIGSVYGDQAAKTFLDGELLWRFHIEQFVAYTVALAKQDAAAQQEAVGKLMGYVEAQSSFLADATGADKTAVRDALSMHVMELKGQLDAYAKGDYEQAYALAREAYAHMFATGDALAAAIVAQGKAS